MSITSVATLSGSALNSARTNLAVAVFAPAAAGFSWAGTASVNSSTWDKVTPNWIGQGGQGSTYTDGFPAIFTDAGTNTDITIASTVQPSKVWFNNQTVPYSFSGAAISGTASVTVAGAGSVAFNSPNTYSGGTYVYNGSLTAQVNGALGSGPVTVSGGNLTINTATLGSGPVSVSAGTLTVGNDAALSSGTVSATAPATVAFVSPSPAIGALTGNANYVLGNASTSAPTSLTLNVGSGTTTVSNSIGEAAPGLGSVTKTGNGTLTLTGNNTYSGNTNINQGTVVAVPGQLGSSTIHINGGTFSAPAAQQGLTAQYFYSYAPLSTANGVGAPAGVGHISSSSLSNYNTAYLATYTAAGGGLGLTDNITQDVVDGNFNFDYNNQEGTRFPYPYNQATSNWWTSKYTGYFYAPTTGTYTFATNSDDDSRIWINAGQANPDTAIVVNGTGGQGWAGYGIVQNTTGQVSLVGGQYYPITIAYNEGNGGYGLEAFMAPPGQTLTVGQAGTFLARLAALFGDHRFLEPAGGRQ